MKTSVDTRHLTHFSPNIKRKHQKWFPENNEVDSSVVGVLKEYCRNTTIHGLRYISSDGSSFSDRLCWVVAVVTCVILAVIFVCSAWEKFSTSPIVVNVETTNYPLYKLPFPAITICPSVNVKKRVAEEILSRLFNRSTDDDSFQSNLTEVLSSLSEMQYPMYHRAEEHLNRIDKSLLSVLDTIKLSDFMLQVMPTCKEVFRICNWIGRFLNCCEEMSIQRSEAGFCYSFNSLTSEKSKHCIMPNEYFLEEETPKQTTNYTCNPRRNIAAGTSTGLELFLAKIPEEDSLKEGQLDPTGTRIMVNHPKVPPESAKSIYVPESKSSFFSVKISPSITIASSDMRWMSLSTRECLFPDEHRSKYFGGYTFEGCLMECRLKHIIKKCKCFPFFFDIEEDGVPECKFSQLKCITQENPNMRAFNPPNGIHIYEPELESHLLNCSQCLPTCHEVSFVMNYDIVPDTNPYAKHGIAHLDIFYKDLGAIKYRREQAFSLMQLIVSFGGFMGLFLGISLLSGVELLYYIFKLCKVAYRKYIRTATIKDSLEDIIHNSRVPRFVYPLDVKHSHNTLPILKV